MLVELLSYLGIIIGILISFIAPEEIKPGIKYFKILNLIIAFSIITLMLMLIGKDNILTVVIILILIMFFYLYYIYKKSDIPCLILFWFSPIIFMNNVIYAIPIIVFYGITTSVVQFHKIFDGKIIKPKGNIKKSLYIITSTIIYLIFAIIFSIL